MLENSGQNRLSLMTDVKFSGIHELENPEPVATILKAVLVKTDRENPSLVCGQWVPNLC